MMKTKTNLRTSLITFFQLRIAYCVLPIAYCHLPTVSFAQAPNGTGAGNCLSYNGVNNYVDYGDVALTDFGTAAFTIEFWIATTSNSPVVAVISKRPDFNGAESLWDIRMIGGKLSLEIYTNVAGDDAGVIQSSTVNDGLWHHIAFTRIGTTLRNYTDGVLQATVVATGTANIMNTAPVWIGKDPVINYDGTVYFSGQLDEVRIWNQALTQTEIQQNMCQKLKGNEAGLVGYWRFDEGSGTTAFDASLNGNNGTLW